MSWSIYRNTGDSNSTNSNLVDPENLGAAQEHKITIDIMSPNPNTKEPLDTITGFMKEAFNYSVGAKYESIMNYNDPYSIWQSLLKDSIQANNSLYSGYTSKKIFTPGDSYVKLSLKYRVHDDPDVVLKCDKLVKCCLPIMDSGNFLLTTNAIEAVGGIIGNGVDLVKAVGGELGEGDVGGAFGEGFASLQANMATKMPPHLVVSIGSYFKKAEMVITSVNFTFSKEFSRHKGVTYPTYVDFDLEVESLYSSLALAWGKDRSGLTENQKIFGPGLLHGGVHSRIKFVDTVSNEILTNKPIEDAKNAITDIKMKAMKNETTSP